MEAAVKISDLKITVVDNPHAGLVTRGIKGGKAVHQIAFLRVLTDDGCEGHTFASGGRSGLATARLIASTIRPLLIGEDPLNSELIWQKIRQIPQEPFSFGVRNPIRIDSKGYVHVPDLPGLRVDLDWAARDTRGSRNLK